MNARNAAHPMGVLRSCVTRVPSPHSSPPLSCSCPGHSASPTAATFGAASRKRYTAQATQSLPRSPASSSPRRSSAASWLGWNRRLRQIEADVELRKFAERASLAKSDWAHLLLRSPLALQNSSPTSRFVRQSQSSCAWRFHPAWWQRAPWLPSPFGARCEPCFGSPSSYFVHPPVPVYDRTPPRRRRPDEGHTN